MADSKYKAAGVDIDAAMDAVERIKPAIRATYTDAVLADVGSFGGLFSLGGLTDQPVLVSSIDGVGTKVKLAADMGLWSGIGHDIVNHCTNDILVQNARPLFFMDYVATDKIAQDQVAEVVVGIAEACKRIQCALLAGETAEMPGVYADGAFDVVGAIVGIADRQRLLPDTEQMQAGDVLIGLPSSGPHTNGYTLIRHAVADKDLGQPLSDGRTLGEALLAPHRAYVNEIDRLYTANLPPLGLAHITGGGLVDNVPRVLPGHLAAEIDRSSWATPEVFRLVVDWAEMAVEEPYRVFNMGVGMVIIVPEEIGPRVLSQLPEAFRIGSLVERGDNG